METWTRLVAYLGLGLPEVLPEVLHEKQDEK
jgi:hypothetical protein